VLLVSRNGETVVETAYGHALKFSYGGEPLASPERLTARHRFDVASLTKVFATTFAMMLLVDRGSIAIDAPVYAYLTDYRGARRDSITVRHLLTHTAGLPQWQPVYYHARTAADAYVHLRSVEPVFPVGRERHYSDLGFMLLGALVERVAGMPLDRYLQRELYGPLGLLDTGFLPLHSEDPLIAATSDGNPFEHRMILDPDFGYLIEEDESRFSDWRAYTLVGEVNDGNAWYAFEGVAGHAGLFSTASDLNKLMQLLLNRGTYGGRRYLQERTVEEFLTPDQTGNGLGWAMAENSLPVSNPAPGTFGHTGFTGTYAVADPASKTVIILLTNRQHGGPDPDGYYPPLGFLQSDVTTAVLGQEGQPATPPEAEKRTTPGVRAW